MKNLRTIVPIDESFKSKANATWKATKNHRGTIAGVVGGAAIGAGIQHVANKYGVPHGNMGAAVASNLGFTAGWVADSLRQKKAALLKKRDKS